MDMMPIFDSRRKKSTISCVRSIGELDKRSEADTAFA